MVTFHKECLKKIFPKNKVMDYDCTTNTCMIARWLFHFPLKYDFIITLDMKQTCNPPV